MTSPTTPMTPAELAAECKHLYTKQVLRLTAGISTPQELDAGDAEVITAIDRLASLASVAGEQQGWRPIDSAPKDGTAVLLLIEDGEHPFQDEGPNVTIGSFGIEGGPKEDPTWHFAGWSWHHDCYCRGSGTPVGWMPLPGSDGPAYDQLRTERDTWKRWCEEAEATAAGNALSWAVDRWLDEVKHRPLVNVHRRTLDGVWRQVIRHFGGDPDALVGPAHDALLGATRSQPLPPAPQKEGEG